MQKIVEELNDVIVKHTDTINEIETPDSFQITYLKSIKKEQGYGYFVEKAKKNYLEVKTEKIGHLFNKRRIYYWLCCKYPNKIISYQDVERCFNIFSLFLKKTNTHDGDYGKYREFYYSKWFKNYGIFTESRENLLKILLSQDDVRIMCFNIDEQQQNPETKSTYHFTLEKKKNPIYKDFLVFSLNDIRDDWAYNIAINYLNSIPDFQGTYDLLHLHFKLSRDIINHICGFLDLSSS